MYQKTLTLSPNEDLQISWEENWLNMNIRYNGAVIGTIEDAGNMYQTLRLPLADDREIFVLVVDGKLEVWYKRQELVSDVVIGQSDAFGTAWKGLVWYSGLQALIAGIAMFSDREDKMEVLIGTVIFIVILVGLSTWARLTGSKIPYWMAIGISVLNIGFTLLSGSIAGIFTAGILVYYLYKGTQAEPSGISRKERMEMDGPLDSGI